MKDFMSNITENLNTVNLVLSVITLMISSISLGIVIGRKIEKN